MAPGGGQSIPTERQVQRAVLAMIRTCFPRCFVHHSPNGAHLAGSGAARFKQVGALLGDGMVKGFPDLAIFWPGKGGAFIECKRPKTGKVSDEQKAVHELLASLGWPIAVVRSVDEAYEFLKSQGAPWSGAAI